MTIILIWIHFFSLQAQETEHSPLLEVVLEIPEVKKAYDDCVKDPELFPNLATCLDQNITPAVKVKVAELLKKKSEKDSSDKKSPGVVSDSFNLAPKKETKGRTKAMSNLHDFYMKKLEEALFGKEGTLTQEAKGLFDKLKGEQKMVDEKTFFELYRTQVSKSLIHVISSFCMDTKLADSADPGSVYIPFPDNDQSKELNKVREENIKQLTTAQGAKDSSERWLKCAGVISDLCMKKDSYTDESYCSGGCKKDDYDYTVRRSCEVAQFISKTRQEMLSSGSIIEKLEKLPQRTGVVGYAFYGNSEKDASIDDLTDYTSNEFVGKSSLKKSDSKLGVGIKEDSELLKKCKDKDQIKSSECQEFLQTLNVDNRRIYLEAVAAEARIADRINNFSKEDMVQALVDKGVEKAVAEAQLANNQAFELRKKELLEQYQRRIDELKKTAEVKDVKVNQEVAALIGQGFEKEDAVLLARAEQEIQSDPARFAQLIHYSNVVSGFLETTAQGKNPDEEVKFRNTAILKKELKDSVFDPENFQVYKETLGEDEAGKSILGIDTPYSSKQQFTKTSQELINLSEDGQPDDASEIRDNVGATTIQVEQINNALLKDVPKKEP